MAQPRYIFQEQVSSCKEGFGYLINSLHVFLKAINLASDFIQTPLPNSKTEIGSTKP